MTNLDIESGPDWPRRARAKHLIRLCEDHNLKEALHLHALSLFGRDVWSLTEDEMGVLESTFYSFATVLGTQLDKRTIN
ncbi:MAG: hypothetical protein AAGC62_16550 [Pseudomonadota bacterium]